ncbi:MAG: tape measure protein, partial [Waterburya sp.]
MNVGQLNFEVIADTKKLLKDLKKITDQKYKIKVEPIAPEVDLSQLHELNKTLDQKQRHLDETRQKFQRNPIEPEVDTSGIKDGAKGAKVDFDQLIDYFETTKFTESITDSLKGVLNVGASPFKAVGRGFFEGIGQSFAKDFTKGFKTSVEDSIGFTTKDVGSYAGGKAAEGLGKVAEHFGVNIDDVAEEINKSSSKTKKKTKKKSQEKSVYSPEHDLPLDLKHQEPQVANVAIVPVIKDRGGLDKAKSIVRSNEMQTVINAAAKFSSTILKVTLDVAKFGYGVAKVAEDRLFSLDEQRARGAKRVMQVGGGLMAASQVPGAMPLLTGAMDLATSGSSAIASPLVHELATMLSSGVTSSLSGLPFGGGAVVGTAVESLATALGTSIAELLPILGAFGITVKASDAVIKTTARKIEEVSNSKAAKAGEDLANKFFKIGGQAKSFGEAIAFQSDKIKRLQSQLPSKKEFAQLPPAERIEKAKLMANIAAQGIADQKAIMGSIPKNQRAQGGDAARLNQLTSQLSQIYNKAKSILAKEKIDINDVVNMKNITAQVEVIEPLKSVAKNESVYDNASVGSQANFVPLNLPVVEYEKEIAEAVQAVDTLATTTNKAVSTVNNLIEDIDIPKNKKYQPGDIAKLPLDDLHFDPKRFQYKLLQTSATGESGSLSGVKSFDRNLAGVVQVWTDPQDGKNYIINGHNRASLAKKLGQKDLDVRFIEAKNASEARRIGALTNIAEGRGNALDAAKFFRESKITSQSDLNKLGIPLKERIASEGLGIAKLPSELFDMVVQSQLPMERAARIGNSGLGENQQRELFKLIQKQKNITNDAITELADMVKASEVQSTSLFDLFGSSTEEQSLAVEMASLQSKVKRRLNSEKKLFGLVGKEKTADQLGQAGNVINVDESANRSKSADSALIVFDRLKNLSGGVNKLLNRAAKEINGGKNRQTVEAQLYKQILPLIANIAKNPTASNPSQETLDALIVASKKTIPQIEKEFNLGSTNAGTNWGKTSTEILDQFKILAIAAKEKGYDIQRFISEGSPGTTERIRKHWLKTAKYVIGQINEIQQHANKSGLNIQTLIASPQGRKHIKDATVNGVGAIAGIGARVATGGFPGAGMAGEYAASLATRKAVTDIETTIDVFNRIISTSNPELESSLALLLTVIKESAIEAKSKKQGLRKDIDDDVRGFAIGNIAATAAQGMGARIPFVGAATAIAVNKFRERGSEVNRAIAQGSQSNDAHKQAMKQVGNDMLRSFDNTIERRSPPKKFWRRGVEIAQAIAGGIHSSGKSVSDATRKLGENALKGVQNTAKDLGDAYSKNVAQALDGKGYTVNKQKAENKTLRHTRSLIEDKTDKRKLSDVYHSRIEAKEKEIVDGGWAFKGTKQKQLARLQEQKQKALELEKLLFERYEQLDPVNLLKRPLNYLKRSLKMGYGDRRIKVLSEQVADKGTETYYEGQYRQGNQKVRRQAGKGLDPKQANAAVGEIPGFALSVATMINAWSGVAAMFAPLVEPLLPILTTAMGLANIIAPHIQAIKQAILETEPLIKRLETSVAGSMLLKEGQDRPDPKDIQSKGAEELEYVTKVSTDLKIPLKPALSNYAKLAIAAQRTKLEGDGTKELFEGISASIRAMRLSTAEADLVFTAYVQMLSKGKINMEELRQQLGEKFPPAMSVFAKAMGVTVAEFDELSKKGALMSEEVLPKVAQVLKEDYGGSFQSFGTDYVGALANMENATFKFQKAVAESYGGLFAGITNIFAKLTSVIGGNFDILSKIITAGLIGIGAQVGIGLTMMLSVPKVATKMAAFQALVKTSFRSALVGVAPFLVGVLADVIGDIFGAKNTIFENMSKGMTNMFLGVASGVQSVKLNATGEGFAGSVKSPDEKGFFGGIKEKLGGGIIPSGAIEIAALALMFEQLTTLGKMFLAPTFLKVKDAVFAMSGAFREAFLSGKGLKGMFNTIFTESAQAQGALQKLTGVATSFGLAIAVIALSKSDFSDPLIASFHKAEKSIIASISNIKKEMDGLKPPENPDNKNNPTDSLPSKGLELNPKVWLGMSENSLKSDDIYRKMNQVDNPILSPLVSAFRFNPYNIGKSKRMKRRADDLGIGEYFTGQERDIELIQEQLLMQATKLKGMNENIYNQLSETGIAPHHLKNGIPEVLKSQLKGIAEIDSRLGDLGRQKFKLTIEGTPEAKKKVLELREEIRDLQLERKEKIKPIKNIVEQLDFEKKRVENEIKAIDDDPNYNPGLKNKLKEPLLETKDVLDEVISKMKDGGMHKAVEELGDSWAKVVGKLKDADLMAEKMQRTNMRNRLNAEKEIYQSYKTSKGSSAASEGVEINFLKSEAIRITAQMTAQRKALEDLLSIDQVEENPERAAEIEELRKDLIKSEDELAQTQTNLAKSLHQQAIAVKEFKYSLEDLKIQSLQLDTQTLQYQLDSKIKLDPKLNEDIFNNSQQLDTQLRSNADALRSQVRSLEDFLLSLEDYTYSLKDAVFSLQKQARDMAANIAKTSLGSNGAFFSAAGIQNQITDFFGKMSDLVGQASDITLSDTRPQLKRDLERSERDYTRNQRDNQRRKEDINVAFSGSQLDSNQAIARLNREITLLTERQDIDKNELVSQALTLEQQYRNYNRGIDESREVGRAYGIPVSVTQKEAPVIDTSNVESNLESVQSQIIAGKQKLIQAYQDKTAKEEQAIKEKLSRITEAEKEAGIAQQELRNENLNLQKLEGQRIVAENEKLAKTIEGTYIALQKSLKFGKASINLESDRISLGNQDFYSSIPDQKKQAMNALTERMLSLQGTRDDLSAFLDNSQMFTSPQDLLSKINQLEIDPALKQDII